MVGREILARAAIDPEVTQLLCLIRPTGQESAEERLAALCQTMAVPVGAARAVAGDVTEPGLGVPADDLADVTHVIHCAASVSFDLPLAEARRINVTGTQHVLDACRTMPLLKRLDAVSTCYVAGRRTGLILESDLEHGLPQHLRTDQVRVGDLAARRHVGVTDRRASPLNRRG